MRSGRINKLIRIEKPDTQTDLRSGQKVEGWVLVEEVWAAIEPLRGQALYTAQQENSHITTSIIIRYQLHLAEIDHTHSLLFGSTRYEILHDPINPNMSNRELHFMCKVMS